MWEARLAKSTRRWSKRLHQCPCGGQTAVNCHVLPLVVNSLLRALRGDRTLHRKMWEASASSGVLFFQDEKAHRLRSGLDGHGQGAERSNARGMSSRFWVLCLGCWWPVSAGESGGCQHQCVPRTYEIACCLLSSEGVSKWKMCALTDSAPAHTSRNTQQLLAEVRTPTNWLPYLMTSTHCTSLS